VSADDEEVLGFIGSHGQTADAISERFPGFELLRLVRARLVEEWDKELRRRHTPIFHWG